MLTRTLVIAAVVGLSSSGCSSDSEPGPSSGGTGATGGAGTGGSGFEAGPPCIDDHTEQRIGKVVSCGGHYCEPGVGCQSTCENSQDCRPGYTCLQSSPSVWGCTVVPDM